jgi:hypothetical protein
LSLQEELDVTVHQIRLDIMESEYICVRPEQLQTKSRADPRFRPASDEELDKGDLVHIAGEHREKCRCWFLVLALIKGINDDEGWMLCCLEWPYKEFLQLRRE